MADMIAIDIRDYDGPVGCEVFRAHPEYQIFVSVALLTSASIEHLASKQRASDRTYSVFILNTTARFLYLGFRLTVA